MSKKKQEEYFIPDEIVDVQFQRVEDGQLHKRWIIELFEITSHCRIFETEDRDWAWSAWLNLTSSDSVLNGISSNCLSAEIEAKSNAVKLAIELANNKKIINDSKESKKQRKKKEME